MDTSIFSSILEHYQGLLSVYTAVGIMAVVFIGKRLLLLIPAIRQTQALNKKACEERNTRSFYPRVQKRVRVWGLLTDVVIFALVLPFCLTLEAQPWWKMLLDIFAILMVYDFFYYLTHRFLFHAAHDSRFAVLRFFRRVHAVHHQARDPSHIDAFYVHPVETTIGQLLFHFTVLGLGVALGGFHVVSVAIASLVYIQLNTFNHVKFELPGYKLLNWISFKHHVHHIDMQKGNYATITLLYDKLFGTLD